MRATQFDEVVTMNMGEGIEALLLIRGCSKNSDGDCLVTADYVIKSPDGSNYQEALNTDVWKDTALSSLQYHLTNTRMGLALMPQSDPGLYTVYVTVSDKISNTEVSLSGKVMVNAVPPEEKAITQG